MTEPLVGESGRLGEMIRDLMRREGITSSALAGRLGKPWRAGAVSRALRAPTLNIAAPMLEALGYFMEIKFRPIQPVPDDGKLVRIALTLPCSKCGQGPGAKCLPWHPHPAERKRRWARAPHLRCRPHRERIDLARGELLKRAT